MNRPRAGGRRGSDWVAEAHEDEEPGRCVVCSGELPPRRSVLCGHPDCARVYNTLSRQEQRVKAKAQKAAP